MIKVFNSSEYCSVCESKAYGGGNATDLIAMGEITMWDGVKKTGQEIVDVVNNALTLFKSKYPYEYMFMRGTPIVYLLNGKMCDTMCVDKRGVIYINVSFLYKAAPSGLGFNAESIMKILYHECMHVLLEHIPRTHKYNEEHNVNKLNWRDMNIAADLEVNSIMVCDKVCDDGFWKKQKGCYDSGVKGLPMETIASLHPDVIKRFRKSANVVPLVQMSQKSNEGQPHGEIIYDDTTPAYKKGHSDAIKRCNRILQAVYGVYDANTGGKDAVVGALQAALKKIQQDLTTKPKNPLKESVATPSYTSYDDGYMAGMQEVIQKISGMIMQIEEDGNTPPPPPPPPIGPLPPQHIPDLDDEEEIMLPQLQGNDDDDDDDDDGEGGEKSDEKNDNNQEKHGREKDDDDNDDDDNDDDDGDGEGQGNKNNKATQDGAKKHTAVGEIISDEELQKLSDSLLESGFSKECVERVKDDIANTQTKGGVDAAKVRERIRKNKPSSNFESICSDIEVNKTVVKKMWEEIVKMFLEDKTLHIGSQKKVLDPDNVRWGDRRVLGLDMIRLYQTQADAVPQNINILVDTSGSINVNTTKIFIETVMDCCEDLEYSGLYLIPWADKVDAKSGIYVDCADIKTSRNEIRGKMMDFTRNNNAGDGTDIKPVVKFMQDMWAAEPLSVWIILTDGDFTASPLLTVSQKEQFIVCIYGEDIRQKMRDKWMLKPAYKDIGKVFIDTRSDQQR